MPSSQLSQTSISTDYTCSTSTTGPLHPHSKEWTTLYGSASSSPARPTSSATLPTTLPTEQAKYLQSKSTPELPPFPDYAGRGKENVLNLSSPLRGSTGPLCLRSSSSPRVKDRNKASNPDEDRIITSASTSSLRRSSGPVPVISNPSSPRLKDKKRKRGDLGCQHGSDTEPEESPPARPGPALNDNAPSSDSSISLDATLNAASSSSNDTIVVFGDRNALGRR